MSNDNIIQLHRKLLLLPVIMILLIMQVMPIHADETDETPFSDLIAKLQMDNVIPAEEGRYISFGDFEDDFAKLGVLSMTPLLEADRFVFSADISWSSGSQTPNAMTSGCGVVFNKAEDSKDYLMVSIRMDGYMYISAVSNYRNLSYGKIPFTLPSIIGGGKLLLVVDGPKAVIYLNGKQIAQRTNLPAPGEIVGLAVLSGTNKDFGTRCVFKNIDFYLW